MRKFIFLILSLSLGFVTLTYTNCSSYKNNYEIDGGTSTGNPPSVGVKVAGFVPTSSGSQSLCASVLHLQPANYSSEVTIQLDFTAGEKSLSVNGTNLASLVIPMGQYMSGSIELKDGCGTGNSLSVVNDNGSFGTSDTVFLQFYGMVTIDSQTRSLVFQIQSVVSALEQVTSDSQISAQVGIVEAWHTSNEGWNPMTLTGAPVAREAESSFVWSGSELIVWGGRNSSGALRNGAKYNPVTDSWSPVSTVGAPPAAYQSATVWTDREMFVWGGWNLAAIGSGARYNPLNDTWTAVTTVGAPAARREAAVVWTGTEVIVWGGYNGSELNTGGRYNPATNTWTPTSTIGAPSARITEAIWTGTEMIVWGGYPETNTGARYNPATNTWAAMSTLNAPSARYDFPLIWTGNRMIVWGGSVDPVSFGNGAMYDPQTDTWTAMTTVNAPQARDGYLAVWTGTEMIVWGGINNTLNGGSYLETGGRYNPNTDTWISLPIEQAPIARDRGAFAWTGAEMVIWGGEPTTSSYTNTGARFSP